MTIASSQLALSASHQQQQQHSVSESLRFWVGQQRPNAAPPARQEASQVSLSDAGRQAQSADQIDRNLDDAVDKDPNLNLLRRIMEALTGEKIRVLDVASLQASVEQQTSHSETAAVQQGEASAGYGLAYDYHESYSESEQTTFSASGTVRTKDGQEISFQLSFSMSRSYSVETSTSLRLGDAARTSDPLVVNFAGSAAQLQSSRFSFDLNSDGASTERINRPAAGSGFLVFDRNGDLRANDGSELFGTKSGDGFADLAKLDDDKNGWIDENDTAYQKLKIWQPDDNGVGQLQSLETAGVAALSLTAAATPFALKDEQNALLGQIRQTGVMLQKNGAVGTLQQVDLTV